MILRPVQRTLLTPELPFWKHCLFVFLLCLLPTLLTALPGRWIRWTGSEGIGYVLAPAVEILFLTTGLTLLGAVIPGRRWRALAAGLICGAWNWEPGVGPALASAWVFTLLGCSFLTWRAISPVHGYVAAAAPYLLLAVVASAAGKIP